MKRSKTKIENFYKKRQTALDYERIRFSSPGGQLVSQIEISRILAFLPTDCNLVLDLGAGAGRVSRSLLQAGYKVTALDSSKAMLAKLKKVKNKNLRTVEASAFSLPFKSNQFEAATSLRFLDHFDKKDLGKILGEVRRVLKKDGFFIFNTLNQNSLERILPDIFSKRKHANFYYSTDFLKKFFQKNGWQVEEVEGFFVIPRGFYLHLPTPFPNIFLSFDKFLIKIAFSGFSACTFWRLKKK